MLNVNVTKLNKRMLSLSEDRQTLLEASRLLSAARRDPTARSVDLNRSKEAIRMLLDYSDEIGSEINDIKLKINDYFKFTVFPKEESNVKK